MRYILASKSPRRKDLMKYISSDFLIAIEDIDESSSYNLSPVEAVKEIAKRKGEAVYKSYPKDLIISADTIVVLNNKIIGKPKDEIDAMKILKELSNQTHYVYTGFAIHYQGKLIVDVVETKVIFNKLNDELIKDYVKSGSPLDKAGAYGIQDNDNFPIIKNIIGSYDNVVGFPVKEIKEKIEEIVK